MIAIEISLLYMYLYIAEQRLEQPEEPYWTLDQLERGDDLESDL